MAKPQGVKKIDPSVSVENSKNKKTATDSEHGGEQRLDVKLDHHPKNGLSVGFSAVGRDAIIGGLVFIGVVVAGAIAVSFLT